MRGKIEYSTKVLINNIYIQVYPDNLPSNPLKIKHNINNYLFNLEYINKCNYLN